jgi:KaiC/GvpD/RAD55 family RecA-like ATPase
LVYRLILPKWANDGSKRRVLEGEYTQEQLDAYNADGYNVYFLPNSPSQYQPGVTVEGSHIDCFKFVFVDMDLKDGVYESKEAFVAAVHEAGLDPTYIVDSGNGVHVYWQVSDLDAMSYLRLQRRLMRKFKTDEAVGQIYQLMRLPGSVNTKDPENPKLCSQVYESENVYTCEQVAAALAPITHADEEYCKQHYDKTYKTDKNDVKVDDKIPLKFAKLVRENKEVKDIWSGNVSDRSIADFRLGHIMFAHGFSREEAMSVLVNSAKALNRAPVHRVGYAENIVDKIWTFEESEDKEGLDLSSSVKDILSKSGDTLQGTRFPCHSYLDATETGFRLGQVIGLVAGVGVGKTAMALNMFMGFVQNNPDYTHFFVCLEQPKEEIAARWRTMCGERTTLYDKVEVIDNYNKDKSFRHLSLEEIKQYILKFQKVTGKKVGAVVIDHIGVLKKKGKNGENQDIIDLCHEMKPFALETNTMVVMQSQAPREKAGIGDIELNKDAAYGTVFFESYVDYLITIWQPLKRCYSEEGCPTVTAFKFCKIRHKKQHLDHVKEDVCYRLFFDPQTEHMRELTQDEEKSFDFFANKALNARKRDRKTDIVPYQSIRWTKGEPNESDNASSA